jgi:hypothetical protein
MIDNVRVKLKSMRERSCREAARRPLAIATPCPPREGVPVSQSRRLVASRRNGSPEVFRIGARRIELHLRFVPFE